MRPTGRGTSIFALDLLSDTGRFRVFQKQARWRRAQDLTKAKADIFESRQRSGSPTLKDRFRHFTVLWRESSFAPYLPNEPGTLSLKERQKQFKSFWRPSSLQTAQARLWILSGYEHCEIIRRSRRNNEPGTRETVLLTLPLYTELSVEEFRRRWPGTRSMAHGDVHHSPISAVFGH